MREDELTPEELLAMVQANRRAVQGYWTWRDKALGAGQEKWIEEIGACRTILEAAGLLVEDLRPGEDPPDCEATVSGERWGIELTELVHEQTLTKAFQRRRENKPPPDPFAWTRETLLASLQERITDKDRSANRWSGSYDRAVLVIYTAEGELHREAVTQFLDGAAFHTHALHNVFLGLSYHPSTEGDGGNPVFPLAVDRSG